jgi:hypothetical protein
MFLVLASVNLLGALLLALRLPVFSAIKAAYVLNALPAFAVFMAVGIASLARWKPVHATVLALLTVMLPVAAAHVIWLAVIAVT